MKYQEILDKIFTSYPMYQRVGSSAYKEGLENIEFLDELCGHPHQQFRTIHVAGTNGKGSVSHLLSSYFQEAGFKTGLYTSPHLFNFTERIKINGKEIVEGEVVDFFEQYEKSFAAYSPSFFEVTTMLAFHYFAKERVDIAIIETGLGGRLDSTNIIRPMASIITNIAFDHTALLGDTVQKIAFEKGGIIKENTPVIIGKKELTSWSVFSAIAQEKNAPITDTCPFTICDVEDEGCYTTRTINIFKNNAPLYNNVKLPLLGDYQLENVKTFLQAIEIITPILNIEHSFIPNAIKNVLSNTHLQGRWQVVNTSPLTICDVGHNPAGMEQIVNQLLKHRKRVHFVLGFVNDKDVESLLQLLPKENFTYYLCCANIPRALSVEVLETICAPHQLHTISCGTVAQGYRQAVAEATSDEIVFIGGSCFVVGDFLKSIQY